MSINTKKNENKTVFSPPLMGRQILLTVSTHNEHFTLNIDDIAYFRFNNGAKQWEVVCQNGSWRTLRHRTTSDIILGLSHDFVRIHKRFIVNIRFIHVIQDTQCLLRKPLHEVTELKISKNYRHELMGRFCQI